MAKNPAKILLKRYKLLVFAGVVGALLSLLLNFLIFPLEYRADAQILIISQTRTGVDPYTVIRSAERVGENLIQIMKTEDFLNKVLQNTDIASKLDLSNLSEKQRRNLWSKTIDTSVVYGTGVLNVSAYNQSPGLAEEIAGAVVETLVSRGWEYVGGDVVIKVVNSPVATSLPVRPNLPVNVFVGFLAGILIMGAVVVRRFA